jgi:enhancing lycopene biosynthesis protein 2
MMKNIAVIIAGCGVYDGTEIHESVLTLLALDKAGVRVQCFAPDMDQMHVINHVTGEEMAGESRNALIEAARISRGNIKNLAEYSHNDFDALILPGGFGAAKNLCDFAVKGGEMNVQADVARAVSETHAAGKPIGALCIAPVVLAKVIAGAKVTIGQDPEVSGAIENAFGGQHEKTTHGEIVIDEKNKLVTTPCYMLEASISQIADGAENVVKAVLDLCD